MFRVVLLLTALMLVACTPTSITISLGAPTATPTFTPTSLPTATATSTPDATATAGAQASATAQAKATADAQATATAQARASATAAAATAQANATATAQAATAATKTAVLAYVDALLQKALKPVRFPDGRLDSTNNMLYAGLDPKNFVADIEFGNPADSKIHPWDLLFMFRRSSVETLYLLVLYSNGTWNLLYPGQRQADRNIMEAVANGSLPMMNLSPTGSNKVRLVVSENIACLFMNGELAGMMDVSRNPNSGQLFITTGQMTGDNFPDLAMPYKGVVVTGLP